MFRIELDYEAFLRQRIFDPCSMPDTTFLPTDDQWARMITMHNYRDGVACVFQEYPAASFQGGAGLISTLRDYTRFARMLSRGGSSALTGKTFEADVVAALI